MVTETGTEEDILVNKNHIHLIIFPMYDTK